MSMNITPKDKKIYSVSEITRDIRLLLEDSFNKVWIEGEVSNFVRHSSGHCYFSIKDSDSVLASVMFKHSAYKIKFKIEDGMSIVCLGKISVYNKRGQYQLYVEEIEPKGVGSLQLAFTQLKEKLHKEGLFDEARKLPIPYLPKKIGVVTSPTGAAIRDMTNVLERRFPNMHILLYPAKVQGDGAAEEIRDGIEAFNQKKDVDVIIVGRGGGSLEDLWVFNEEVVARAIFDSKIPIISAVGHEIDYTIADFVADLRAPTPSVAAEIVVAKKEDIVQDIEHLRDRLKQSLLARIDILKRHLDAIMQRHAFRQPHFLIEQYQQRLDEQARTLSQSLNHFLKIKEQQLHAVKGRLNALSPVAILERGYSITTSVSTGKIVKAANQLKRGMRIKSRLAKGEVVSEVK